MDKSKQKLSIAEAKQRLLDASEQWTWQNQIKQHPLIALGIVAVVGLVVADPRARSLLMRGLGYGLTMNTLQNQWKSFAKGRSNSTDDSHSD